MCIRDSAHVVRDAMLSGVRMVIVHEKEVDRGAVAFGAFFDGRTPQDLVDAKLYNTLAVPLCERSPRYTPRYTPR